MGSRSAGSGHPGDAGTRINSLHGARGVPLADIVQEHRDALKRDIDAGLVELVEEHHTRLHEQLDEALESPTVSDTYGEQRNADSTVAPE